MRWSEVEIAAVADYAHLKAEKLCLKGALKNENRKSLYRETQLAFCETKAELQYIDRLREEQKPKLCLGPFSTDWKVYTIISCASKAWIAVLAFKSKDTTEEASSNP